MTARHAGIVFALLTIGFLLGFGNGVVVERYSSAKQENVELRAENKDLLSQNALNEVRLQIADYGQQHDLTYQDAMLQAAALNEGVICNYCEVWERFGSQDYYSLPVVMQLSNFGEQTYSIVPARVFHVNGQKPTYEPTFAIYLKNRSGAQFRLGPDGTVSSSIGESGWLPVSDPDAARQLREGAWNTFVRRNADQTQKLLHH